MKRTLRSMLVLGALALSGCGDSTGPQLQPETVPFLFACNTWTPELDPSRVVLADLQLNAETGSVSAAALAVRGAGGRVVRRFNVPAVRVVIRAGDIPGLPGVESARGVTDPESTHVRVVVVLSRTPTEADVQAIQARGGRDVAMLPLSKLIVGSVPDAAIPEIERLSGVSRVYGDGIGCAGF